MGDNYYAALNSAVFSDGSFVYIPKGVKSAMELSTYFRINAQETGQVMLWRLPTYTVTLQANAVTTHLHPAPSLHPACCHGLSTTAWSLARPWQQVTWLAGSVPATFSCRGCCASFAWQKTS